MADSVLAGFYLEIFVSLLPPGRIWPQRSDSALHKLLGSFAVQLAALHETLVDVYAREMYPPTTLALLGEWETMLGLPDPCAPAAQTIQERRARVLQRLTVRPRPTAEYLYELTRELGYSSVTIAETGPHTFTVTVPNARVTYFQTGSSQCGDLLGKIDRADDLECLLTEQKPAHLVIVFNYAGV